MRTNYRATTAFAALALVLAVSSAMAVAEPSNNGHANRSDCADCWREQGKLNLSQDKADSPDATADHDAPSDQGPHDKVAVAAPAKGMDPNDAPEDGPLVAVDDAGPMSPPGNDKVADAAPAQDVDQDNGNDDGPAKVKHKKAGPNDERNSRGERSSSGSSGGGGSGGGRNADGSPK